MKANISESSDRTIAFVLKCLLELERKEESFNLIYFTHSVAIVIEFGFVQMFTL